MTQLNDNAANADFGFVQRVLRAVAIIGIGLGLLHAGSFIVHFVQNRNRVLWTQYGWIWRRGEQLVYLLTVAANLLLLVSAIALLRWKPWARRGLLVWGVASMALGVASALVWFIPYASELAKAPPSTLPAFDSILITGWYMLSSMLSDWAFPLLVLLILRQPQVVGLWARRSKGFEVIPMASEAAR